MSVLGKTEHKGGEATCKDKAICSVCTQPYGSLNKDNHVGETYIKDAVTETCGDDGYTGDTYCLGCEAVLEEGAVVGENPEKCADLDSWGVSVVGPNVTVGKNAKVKAQSMISEDVKEGETV